MSFKLFSVGVLVEIVFVRTYLFNARTDPQLFDYMDIWDSFLNSSLKNSGIIRRLKWKLFHAWSETTYIFISYMPYKSNYTPGMSTLVLPKKMSSFFVVSLVNHLR